MKQKIAVLAILVIGLFNMAALFENFNYVTAEDFMQWLDSGKDMVLVDIQVKDEFSLHHFKNSIETNAFPVETEEQGKMIDPAVAAAKTGILAELRVIGTNTGVGAILLFALLDIAMSIDDLIVVNC